MSEWMVYKESVRILGSRLYATVAKTNVGKGIIHFQNDYSRDISLRIIVRGGVEIMKWLVCIIVIFHGEWCLYSTQSMPLLLRSYICKEPCHQKSYLWFGTIFLCNIPLLALAGSIFFPCLCGHISRRESYTPAHGHNYDPILKLFSLSKRACRLTATIENSKRVGFPFVKSLQVVSRSGAGKLNLPTCIHMSSNDSGNDSVWPYGVTEPHSVNTVRY